MKNLLKYFLQGLLVVVPLAVTVYLIIQIFLILDTLNPLDIPGLGLVLTLAIITAVGFVANHLISDRLAQWFDRLIKRAPIVNIIYSAVRDLLDAFVGNKKSFKKPVLVKLYENSEIRRLGFVTNDNFAKLPNIEGNYLTVYCPHSFNISGNVYLVPPHYVEKLDMNASDVMKYTVSGGVTIIEKSPSE